jgi:hypothetical protein
VQKLPKKTINNLIAPVANSKMSGAFILYLKSSRIANSK